MADIDVQDSAAPPWARDGLAVEGLPGTNRLGEVGILWLRQEGWVVVGFGVERGVAGPYSSESLALMWRPRAAAPQSIAETMGAVLHELRSSGPLGLSWAELVERTGGVDTAVWHLVEEGRARWVNVGARRLLQLTACQRALDEAEARAANIGGEIAIAKAERVACWDAIDAATFHAVDLEPTLAGAVAAVVRGSNDERSACQALRRAVTGMIGGGALSAIASAVEAAGLAHPASGEISEMERLRGGISAIVRDLGDDFEFARVRHDLQDLLGAPRGLDRGEDAARPAGDGDELGAEALARIYDDAVYSWPARRDAVVVPRGFASVLAVRNHVLRAAGRRLQALANELSSRVAEGYCAALVDAAYVVGCALRAPKQPRLLSARVLCPDGTTQRGLVLADLSGWARGSAHRWVLTLPETRARVFARDDGSIVDAPAGVRLHAEDLRALRGEA